MSKSIAAGGALNDGFVGDVVTSMLTEAQFQNQRNAGWVLMDGRNVNGSKYSTITGNSNIPDARGLFLRGKNNGRIDGLQNPDGDLAIGTYQSDAFASHTHIQNSHNHSTNIPALAASGTDGGPAYINTTASVTGSTTATNQNSGGNETRPKNITVNYFIKIN